MSEFDLDGFLDSAVGYFAQKHGTPDSGTGKVVQRAFDRAAKDQRVHEQITRREGPKMTIRDGKQIWTPRG